MMTCAESIVGIWKNELGDAFFAGRGARRIVIRRHQDIYTCGTEERTVYFVESGSIKLTTQSATGRECLLGIQVAGELFGELSLLGSGGRLETATARENGAVWRMHVDDLVRELHGRALYEEFMLQLLRRVAEQERRITHLVTEPGRRRLGEMLLLLGRRIGTRTGEALRINLRISQDEWAAMIGTTRPRVSTFFCDFERLNLVDVTRERHLIINESRLKKHLGEL